MSFIEKKNIISSKTQHAYNNNYMLSIVMIAILGIQGAMVFGDAYDNDMWFLIATGREILENGLFHINPFSIHENMGIVIQQWIPSILDYIVYSSFGMLGIGLLTFFLYCVLVFSMCKMGKAFANGRIGSEIVLALIAASIPALMSYISIRPQIYTMIAFCWILFVCQRYRQTNNTKWLYWLVGIAFIHVNVHASMVLFDLFIVGLFALPSFSIKTFKTLDFHYRRLPMLVALSLMGIAMLLNPYGINGALYLILSYGAADYNNYIKEMNPFIVWSLYGFCMMSMVIITAISIGKRGGQKIDLPMYVLFFVTLALSFQHVRNLWLVIPFAIPIICSALQNNTVSFSWKWLQDSYQARTFASIVAFSLIVSTFTVTTPILISNPEEDSTSVPSVALDYIDEHANGLSDKLKIYNHFNVGGYIEWRGYKTFMDPRPELWQPSITGLEREYYKEYVDSMTESDQSSLLAEYNFDYLIVNHNAKMSKYLKDNPGNYRIAVSGKGYDLWEKNQ